MEDNDKRNSSVPAGDTERGSSASGSAEASEKTAQNQGQSQTPAPGHASEPDLFDAHEATLPRFTIDPADSFPSRQRTRTLLGVPTLVGDEEASSGSAPLSQSFSQTASQFGAHVGAPPPPAPPEPKAAEDDTIRHATGATGGKLVTAILDSGDRGDVETHEALEITVDITDDDAADVTIVSDADLVALPDNTGGFAPVDASVAAAGQAGDADEEAEVPTTVMPSVAAGGGGARAASSAASDPADSQAAARAPSESAGGTPTVTVAAGASGAVDPANPSSLAPREVARSGGQTHQGNSTGDAGRWGALAVAAVVLLAAGAWFLTAGTFRRATVTELPAAEPTTAAAARPTNNMAKPAEATAPFPARPSTATASATTQDVQDDGAPAPADAARASDAMGMDRRGDALKHKPSLTATVHGERVRRTPRPAAKKAESPTPEPGASELPQGPTRAVVISRLENVRSAVRACAAGRSGVADLDITISHTGVVMHVLVGGDFAGTTEGSCIARAVRQARFPAFEQERFRVLYPYAI